MQKQFSITCFVILFFCGIVFMAAGNAFAGCPDPYPPLLAETKNYTIVPYHGEGGVTEFPYWVATGYEDKCDNPGGCYVWEYTITGNLSKIAHIFAGISYDCTKDPIEIMPFGDDGNSAYAAECDGDPSSEWGEGFCNVRVFTTNPQPGIVAENTAVFSIMTNKKSVGVLQIAVDTGKGGTEGGDSPIIGPGYDIPEIILYNEVEELVFGTVKFCLKRTSPYDKCPSEVYANGDLELSCKEIIAVPANLLDDYALSDEVSGFGEGAVFCGQENQECPTCLFQFGTGTTRCVSIGGRLRCF